MYNVEIDIDQADAVTVDVLKSWYEDAMLDDDMGKILSALLIVIEYAIGTEEYESWFTSL